MPATIAARRPRTHRRIADDIARSHARLDYLRRQLDILEPESDDAREHGSVSRRLAALRRELSDARSVPTA